MESTRKNKVYEVSDLTYLKLNDGTSIPRIGLGTSKIDNPGTVVYEAIKDGLRLIDTAERYETEEELGQGIKQAIDEGIVKREDLYIITKLWVDAKHEPEVALNRSLKRLKLDYVDLYLDHWPFSIYKTKDGEWKKVPLHILWKNLEDLVKKGLTKSIGVSNYNVQLLMELLSFAEIKPVVNEIEVHPFLPNSNLINYCQKSGVEVIAYNSLVRGKYVAKFHKNKQSNLLEEETVKKIAEKHNRTVGQVALAWGLTQNLIVVPSSSNPTRMRENLEAVKFRLDEEEMKSLEYLKNDTRFNTSQQWEFSYGCDIFA